jgi:hypothetical protein
MSNRIFYAVQAVGIQPDDTGTISWMHGMQSVGITTNFNLEQVFELGQLALFQNIENIAEIEVTTERVLDGNALTYLTAASSGNSSIVAASNQKAGVYLIIYPDTNSAATGLGFNGLVYCSGMRPSNITYTFPVEGNSTESVTFVGNQKQWSDSTLFPAFNPSTWVGTGTYNNGVVYYPSGAGYYSGINEPSYDSPLNTVFRRQHFTTGVVASKATVIPTEVLNATNGVVSKIQTITVSADMGRENIFELGKFLPYVKYANFPIAVTCDFEVISTSGDRMSSSGENYSLSDRQIIVNFNNGTKTLSIDLGTKNKLTSVNYTGGDTGGGNATMTFSYQGFNAFRVQTGVVS